MITATLPYGTVMVLFGVSSCGHIIWYIYGMVYGHQCSIQYPVKQLSKLYPSRNNAKFIFRWKWHGLWHEQCTSFPFMKYDLQHFVDAVLSPDTILSNTSSFENFYLWTPHYWDFVLIIIFLNFSVFENMLSLNYLFHLYKKTFPKNMYHSSICH